MFNEKAGRRTLLVGAALGLAALLTAGALSLRPVEARAQMSQAVPSCQCSAPTSILNMSVSVAQCLCGAATCVISQDSGPAKGATLMQCVR